MVKSVPTKNNQVFAELKVLFFSLMMNKYFKCNATFHHCPKKITQGPCNMWFNLESVYIRMMHSLQHAKYYSRLVGPNFTINSAHNCYGGTLVTIIVNGTKFLQEYGEPERPLRYKELLLHWKLALYLFLWILLPFGWHPGFILCAFRYSRPELMELCPYSDFQWV